MHNVILNIIISYSPSFVSSCYIPDVSIRLIHISIALTSISYTEYIRVVQKKFFSNFTHFPAQIVRLVIATPHTNFQLIRFAGRGGQKFKILHFRRKIWIFCPL